MSGYALVSIIHSEESVIFLKLYLCLALLSVLYTMCISSNMSQLVGLGGLEPPTSRLSGVRSNHLSYAPKQMLGYNIQIKRVTRIELATTAWKAVVLPLNYTRLTKWRETESNRRHMELQSIALPTELPSQIAGAGFEPTTFGL